LWCRHRSLRALPPSLPPHLACLVVAAAARLVVPVAVAQLQVLQRVQERVRQRGQRPRLQQVVALALLPVVRHLRAPAAAASGRQTTAYRR